ncbi:MAG: 4Fe-4S dicluster domain-containing protein [archaeon]
MTAKKCILCGKCREVCPVYRAVLKETAAPRAKAVLSQAEVQDKLVYLCTMCGSCRVVCPIDADLQVVGSRARLVESGVETGPNKVMVENIRKYGNPFGDDDNGGVE